MKKLIFLTALLFSQQFIAQKHCPSTKVEIEDLNSISLDKCAYKKNNLKQSKHKNKFSSSTRYLNVRKNSNRRGFIEDIAKEREKSSVNSIELKQIRKNITNVVNVNSKELEEEIITFTEVDALPTFTSCGENGDESCFNNKIQQHIHNNFKYPEEALRKHLEGTVFVSFIIDNNGYVANIKTIAPQNADILRKEANRIVSLLPKFKPGKHNDKEVNVSFSFPMKFEIH